MNRGFAIQGGFATRAPMTRPADDQWLQGGRRSQLHYTAATQVPPGHPMSTLGMKISRPSDSVPTRTSIADSALRLPPASTTSRR